MPSPGTETFAPSATTDQAPEISLRGVTFDYREVVDPSRAILSSIDVEIARGEFVVIVGPSGCGKTTMLSLISGLLRTPVGRVEVNGADPATQHDRMGFMPARHGLLPWRTAAGNVAVPLEGGRSDSNAKERKQRARTMLQRVGLAGYENHHPHQLSQGMRQRVSLARALVSDPALLLMDEPFGALDSQTKVRVQAELLSTWEGSGRTAIFISHDLQEAILLADRVLVMDAHPGRIILDRRIEIPRPRAGHLRELVATDEFKEAYEDILGVVTRAELERAAREARG